MFKLVWPFWPEGNPYFQSRFPRWPAACSVKVHRGKIYLENETLQSMYSC